MHTLSSSLNSRISQLLRCAVFFLRCSSHIYDIRIVESSRMRCRHSCISWGISKSFWRMLFLWISRLIICLTITIKRIKRCSCCYNIISDTRFATTTVRLNIFRVEIFANNHATTRLFLEKTRMSSLMSSSLQLLVIHCVWMLSEKMSRILSGMNDSSARATWRKFCYLFNSVECRYINQYISETRPFADILPYTFQFHELFYKHLNYFKEDRSWWMIITSHGPLQMCWEEMECSSAVQKNSRKKTRLKT